MSIFRAERVRLLLTDFLAAGFLAPEDARFFFGIVVAALPVREQHFDGCPAGRRPIDPETPSSTNTGVEYSLARG